MPEQTPKPVGGFSTYDVKTWMVIRWSSLLGALSKLTLPGWLSAVLQQIQIIANAIPTNGATAEGLIVDVNQATVDFGLNEIPTATAQVAVGRLATNTDVLATIHYLVKHLKLFMAASMYCQVEMTHFSGDADVWPKNADGTPKPFRIFDGYIIGTAFRKSTQGVEFNVGLTHWLSDLNFSSSISRSSAVQNPLQLSADPSLPLIHRNAGGIGVGQFGNSTPTTIAMPFIASPAVLINDMWGGLNLPVNMDGTPVNPDNVFEHNAFKGFLTALCFQDRFSWRQLLLSDCTGGVVATQPNTKNVEALGAIQRMEPFSKATEVAFRARFGLPPITAQPTGYIDGVPLRMDIRPSISNIASMIANMIGMEQQQTLYNHTIWDMLIGKYGNELLFAIVPQVEKAMVIPFSPGLRKAWATIFASEYDFIETTENVIRPLRGVCLFISRGYVAGGGLGLNTPPIITPGALYENPNQRNGLVIFKNAPSWIANVAIPAQYPVGGMNPAMTNSPSASIASGLNPAAGLVPTIPQPASTFANVKPLWCDYARALYIQEALRGRSGRLSGRMRFDIAPGSIIRIEEPEERFVLAKLTQQSVLNSDPTAVSSYRHAQVVRVSTVINSEAKKAGTAFQFAFMRDDDENRDQSYSLDRHPLWSCTCFGAPLVNMPEFYPGASMINPQGYPGASPPVCDQLFLVGEEGVFGAPVLENPDVPPPNYAVV